MQKPLVSVIILSYNNFRYIHSAVDSLLEQDYPNYELILSNDGSNDFDEKEISAYIKQSHARNLKKLTIINNHVNRGTVKSLNNAIRIARGEFVIFFAADDAFYDGHVISNFVAAFDKLPPDAQIVTAQLGMYDIDLRRMIQPFVKKQDIRLLRRASPKTLFSAMATRCIIAAASTCYRAKLFKDVGRFDERYKLIEDWSSALRFSRLGVRYYYEDFIAFKHRDGGVSHGNINGPKKLNKQYDLDLVNIMKYEVLPYIDMLDEVQRKKFLNFYHESKWRFMFNHFIISGENSAERRLFIVKNWRTMVRVNLKDLRQYFSEQRGGKKLKMLIFGIFFSVTAWPHPVFSQVGKVLLYSVLLLVAYQLYKMFVPRLTQLIRLMV